MKPSLVDKAFVLIKKLMIKIEIKKYCEILSSLSCTRTDSSTSVTFNNPEFKYPVNIFQYKLTDFSIFLSSHPIVLWFWSFISVPKYLCRSPYHVAPPPHVPKQPPYRDSFRAATVSVPKPPFSYPSSFRTAAVSVPVVISIGSSKLHQQVIRIRHGTQEDLP